MADKLIADCTTGKIATAPFTPDEQIERDLRAQQAEVDAAAREVTATNKTSINDKVLTVDMPAEKAIIDTAALNITGTTVAEVRSSAQAAVRDLQRQVKDLARANRRLSRLLLQMLDGTD